MRFFRWLNSRFERAPVNRVAVVRCGDNVIDMDWPRGSRVSLSIDELRRVIICTTDGGPFDEDVFFVLEADESRYFIPQGAAGAAELLAFLQELPGFDNKAVIESMGCTDNREFVCWERQ
jgi:hypothetical protein